MKHLIAYSRFINEGVKVGPEGTALLSKSEDADDILRFVEGTLKKTGVGGYVVNYRLDSETGRSLPAEDIKATMDLLKLGKIHNLEEALNSFMKPDLLKIAKSVGAYSGFDYIIQVGSSKGLAEAMTNAAAKTFPKAKIVILPKKIHSTYYTAVDYDALALSLANGRDSSFNLVKKFIVAQINKDATPSEVVMEIKLTKSVDELNDFLKADAERGTVTWKPGHTNFKVRKSETIPGNIIRFFNKYEFENDDFIKAISACSDPYSKRYALIIDDNIHNGTDSTNIFKAINSFVENTRNNLSALYASGAMSKPDYERIISQNYQNRFTAYVLYKMKDSDIPKK